MNSINIELFKGQTKKNPRIAGILINSICVTILLLIHPLLLLQLLLLRSHKDHTLL